MSMINCWQIMDHLPGVPDYFVEQALSLSHDWRSKIDQLMTDNASVETSSYFVGADGKKYRERTGPRIPFNEEFEQWVKQNISDQSVSIALAQMLASSNSDIEDTHATSIHTDNLPRKFVLFYVIKKGNDDQWTRWYRRVGKELIPGGEKLFYLSPGSADQFITVDGEELELIDQVCMPSNTWVYADVRILHQSANQLGERIAIQIGFFDDVFNVFNHNN